jgi:hypothetical protein
MVTVAPPLRVTRRGESSPQAAVSSARDHNVQVMLELFRTIEERDPQHRNVERELSFYQPDVEFPLAPALPYGGTFRGLGQHQWRKLEHNMDAIAADRSGTPHGPTSDWCR